MQVLKLNGSAYRLMIAIRETSLRYMMTHRFGEC